MTAKAAPTIFALSSAPGRAGVAVFRISGDNALFALEKLGYKTPKPRVVSLVKLTHPTTGEIIDHGLVLYFPAPHSFTGEDVVELQLHGSAAVTQELLQALGGVEGLRLAEPGEFARRAFEHGKMDLTQAEGLADLIDAETEAQKRQALRQMDGALQRLYEGWRAEMVTILAHLEAYIDFPDEDLPQEISVSLAEQTQKLHDSIAEHLKDARGQRLREGIYVAIVGAPNAGKSSLINALTQRDIAIVSPEAGTTRDAIEAHLNIGGYAVTLCDTAGLRNGTGAIESEGIARARARAAQADIILALFDATAAPDEATLALAKGGRAIAVMTKTDLIPTTNDQRLTTLQISTTTGQGIPELLKALEFRAAELAGISESPALTRERHRAALSHSLSALEAFLTNQQRLIELRAEDIRTAAHALGSITGRIRIEDLMDKIFSSFCIGK